MSAPRASGRARSRSGFLAVVLVMLFAFSAATCGGDGSSTPPTTTTTTTTVPLATRLCAGAAPTQIGTLQSPALKELSGLAASRQYDGVLWAHNDSGDSARIFAIDRSGALRTTVDLDVTEAIDWEDIAADGTTLYVGDIGDNQRARTEIYVYRVAEPALTAKSAHADKFTLHYPDGAHDAEALMVDPVDRQLVVVTKEAAGTSGVYTTPISAPGALQPVTTLSLGLAQLVTAGDISASGDTIVLRTYTNVWVWTRRAGESLATALARPPCGAPAPADAQGEALALTPAADAYVTGSEGAGSPLWEVAAGSGGPAAP